MFRNYLKTAFRNLQRNKVYSFINIIGLSMGLACAMLIILYVKDELSYDRFHKQADQIYNIGMQRFEPDGKKNPGNSITGYFQGPRFAAKIPEIRQFVRLQDYQLDIRRGTEIKSQEILKVDS